jgi:hypothetical protein
MCSMNSTLYPRHVVGRKVSIRIRERVGSYREMLIGAEKKAMRHPV